MDKKTLLIADDDEMNRVIIKKFLKNDFDVIEAADGLETFDKLKSNKVDILLLDIIMPELDGLGVLEKISNDNELKNVGILVATSTKEKTERTALSLGADDVVSKPYDPVVIKKRLHNILAAKEIQLQKELLINNDTESYLDEKQSILFTELTEIIKKIENNAEIIIHNVENHELVREMANMIKKETKDILDTIDKE